MDVFCKGFVEIYKQVGLMPKEPSCVKHKRMKKFRFISVQIMLVLVLFFWDIGSIFSDRKGVHPAQSGEQAAISRSIVNEMSTFEETKRMDELLWTFRDISFLPHCVAGAPDAGVVSVVVGHDEAPPEEHEVLVNLAHPVPLFFSRFERVLEIVGPDDDAKTTARERFRFYKERGYPLESHNIDSNHD